MKKNIFNSLLAVTLCGMIVLTGCGNPKSEENTTVQDAEQNTSLIRLCGRGDWENRKGDYDSYAYESIRF